LKKLIKGVKSSTDTQHGTHMRSIQEFRIYPEGIMYPQSNGGSSFVTEIRCYNDLNHELPKDVERDFLFLDRRCRHEQGK